MPLTTVDKAVLSSTFSIEPTMVLALPVGALTIYILLPNWMPPPVGSNSKNSSMPTVWNVSGLRLLVFCMVKRALLPGEVVAMPTRPLASIWKTVVVAVKVEELTENNGAVPSAWTLATESLAQGGLEPHPILFTVFLRGRF